MASNTISSFFDVGTTLVLGIGMAFYFCWQITCVAFLLIPLTVMFGMLQDKYISSMNSNAE